MGIQVARNDETDAEEETEMRFPWHAEEVMSIRKPARNDVWEQIKFIADCIGLVAGVILIIAAVAAIIA